MIFGFSQTRRTQLTLQGAEKDMFSVEPASTTSDSVVQLLVKQPDKLDFEKIQQTVLQVRKVKNRPWVASFIFSL